MSDSFAGALVGAIVFAAIYIGYKLDKLAETLCPHDMLDDDIAEFCKRCGKHVNPHKD